MEDRMKELAKYRFETSLEDLIDAKLMLNNGRYKNALNRGYYSIFHAIKAICALDGFDSSRHSGVISHFNQNYVKTEIFPKELSKIIRSASENREKADYLDFFIASKEEAEKQIERAERFSSAIKKYLTDRNIIEQ
ncbi:HEPN domain-containing protein [Butyrivibrio sp. VCB2001]|uniref:HEPN domain-containing protein n=1 Tax=Butyrivibrio sp. VCB2001 TaxID=1280667 RepID=UPI000412B194|nr:HEPN domain-containing protein [Butyrivibrio sp. VCB2001]